VRAAAPLITIWIGLLACWIGVLAVTLHRLMMADDAADTRADPAMMCHVMTGDTAGVQSLNYSAEASRCSTEYVGLPFGAPANWSHADTGAH
jgi:hypothetical protein